MLVISGSLLFTLRLPLDVDVYLGGVGGIELHVANEVRVVARLTVNLRASLALDRIGHRDWVERYPFAERFWSLSERFLNTSPVRHLASHLEEHSEGLSILVCPVISCGGLELHVEVVCVNAIRIVSLAEHAHIRRSASLNDVGLGP